MEANRIVINVPPTVFEVLEIARHELDSFNMVCTAFLRYTSPELGGPEATDGNHISSTAWEFTKKIPTASLAEALRAQERYFDKIKATKTCRNRNRHHLKRLVKWAIGNHWLPDPTQKRTPKLNRFNKPRGERRIYAQELRTTSLKHPKSYVLGTNKKDYIVVDGVKILANSTLDTELRELQAFGATFLKPNTLKHRIKQVLAVFGYLYRAANVELADLSLEVLVPFVQMRFSEEDFAGTEDFTVNPRGQLLYPDRAEKTLSSAEAIARRRAENKADVTMQYAADFFEWRKRELAKCNQPEGFSPASKRETLEALKFVAMFQYRNQTNTKETDCFDDISVVKQLRKKIKAQKPDIHKTQKQIKKRSVPWTVAIAIFEKQRLQALEAFLASKDKHRKSGIVIRKRSAYGVAVDTQKTVVLGLMLFVPTDRQQTYCRLQFGSSLKNGYFLDENCEEFVDQGIPVNPDKAQLWINLEEFKTVDSYGEFWYPIPNIQFIDGTTFYQFIAVWLWEFWDEDGTWPTHYKGENQRWQGYIDAEGNRCGWRAALKPDHDLVFTMPNSKTPFYDNTFCAMVRSLCVRFTQEDGKAVPVTPHSFRHMLSNFLEDIGISDKEDKSFSYVLHHSPEMRQGRYVYRDNMARIATAVKRMEQIIKSFV